MVQMIEGRADFAGRGSGLDDWAWGSVSMRSWLHSVGGGIGAMEHHVCMVVAGAQQLVGRWACPREMATGALHEVSSRVKTSSWRLEASVLCVCVLCVLCVRRGLN